MSEVSENGPGLAQPIHAFSIDSALAEWIYHRDGSDQGISITDIASNASVTQNIKLGLPSNLSVSNDYFVYNVADGFTAAVVKIGSVYKIVFRGTDIGDGGFADYVKAAMSGGVDPSKVDNLDIQADYAIGNGTRAPSQQGDAFALTRRVMDLAKDDGSTVQLIGQSLGGAWPASSRPSSACRPP